MDPYVFLQQLPKEMETPRVEDNLVCPERQEPGTRELGGGGVLCPTQGVEIKWDRLVSGSH